MFFTMIFNDTEREIRFYNPLLLFSVPRAAIWASKLEMWYA